MKDHPVVHFEIGCHGGEKTREFFAQLFGWEILRAITLIDGVVIKESDVWSETGSV